MVTLREVARAAGVSAATASRALADPAAVSTDRRQRVLRAAQDLGYRQRHSAQNATAPALRRIGVVVPDMENPYFSGIFKGIQHRARATGLSVFVVDTDEDPRLEVDLVRQMVPQVDGIVLCSPRMSDQALAGLPADVAIVLVNRDSPTHRCITIDHADGVRQALMHVHALGHRRIAYAAGPPGSWSDGERRRGLEVAVDLMPDVDLVRLGHFPGAFSGGVAAADLVTASGATAVLAHNDHVAVGILDRLRSGGTAVPGEVSVVGFDDVAAATQVTPALTTVTVPLRLLGRAAVDVLLDLDGPQPTQPPDAAPAPGRAEQQVRPIPVSLTVRGTTGPRPGTAPNLHESGPS